MVVLRLILAALAISAMLTAPTGFMPARASDGSMILMICPKVKAPAPSPGHAARQAMMHHKQGGDAGDGDHAAHETGQGSTCDYAVGAVADLPQGALPLVIATPIALDMARVAHPLTGIFPRGLPPATGPPRT